MDRARDDSDEHAPEDRAILEMTCPRCGARIPLASQLPLDREPHREAVICPACGYDLRLTSDPTLA